LTWNFSLKDLLLDDDGAYPDANDVDLAIFEMDCSFPVQMDHATLTFYDPDERGVGRYVKLP